MVFACGCAFLFCFGSCGGDVVVRRRGTGGRKVDGGAGVCELRLLVVRRRTDQTALNHAQKQASSGSYRSPEGVAVFVWRERC